MARKSGGKKPAPQGDWEYKEDIYFRGKLIEEKIGYADGVTLTNKYEKGILLSSIRQDSINNPDLNEWSSIETYYENGSIFARITNFDDGRYKYEAFEGGVLKTSSLRDDPYSEGPGAYDWTSIETSYDQNGIIESQHTLYDDARLQIDLYVDGVLTTTTVEDKFLFDGGNYDWDEQLFVYNSDGELALSETTYDDGDAVQEIYTDDLLVARSEFDGDNSESWVGRTTTYNEDGRVASTTAYNTYSDLPADFFVNPTEDDVFAVG